MTALAPPAGFPMWVVRRGSWFIAGLVTASAVLPVVAAIGDLDHSFPAPAPRSQSPVAAVAAGAAIWGLQLRHSLAAARGVRPRGWPWSVAALGALAVVPALWFSVNWISASWFPLAAAVMVLRPRAAVWLMTAALLVQGVVAASATIAAGEDALAIFVVTTYNVVFLGFGVAALYASALLVNQINELHATRADLARSAVSGERRRLSRDLHDLVGQSLSAISLKGDLAHRLLPARRDDALREVEEIAEIARQAFQDVRAIARAEHAVSLRSELDGAVALLEASGIEVRARLALPTLTEPMSALFAWTVREATTNILRHSKAQRCWLTGQQDDGRLRLEIVNDGAAPNAHDQGSGLAGLTERARALGGQVRHDHSRGRFRLVVEAPAGVGREAA